MTIPAAPIIEPIERSMNSPPIDQHRGRHGDDAELGGDLEEVDDARRGEQAAAAGDRGEEQEDEDRTRHGAELGPGHQLAD